MIERRKIDLIHRIALLGDEETLRRTIREMTVAERCDLVGLISFERYGGSLSAHLACSHRHGDHSPSYICGLPLAECLEAALKSTRSWPREFRLAEPIV